MNNNNIIYIVGHARGGTTLLNALISLHSSIHSEVNNIDNKFIDNLNKYDHHIGYALKLEKKELWQKIFKIT